MTTARPPLCFLAFCFLAVACNEAGAEAVEREWPHTGNGSVTVDNAVGSVEVIGWSEPRVRLRGELGARARLSVGVDSPTRLELKVAIDDGDHLRGAGSRLVLQVPHGVVLTVTGVSAGVSVRDMRNAPMVAISTVSGDQHFAGTARAVRLKSVSGDLEFSGASPQGALTTVSGDVSLHDFTGGVAASVVSGDVRVRRSRLGVLQIDSVSGDVEVAANPVPAARWKIGSLGGDIEVGDLDRARTTVSADTFSGSIEWNSTVAHTVGSRRMGKTGRRLRIDPAGANARVIVESFSGDIRFRGAP